MAKPARKVAETPSDPPAENSSVDADAIWKKAVVLVKERRPFIRTWIDQAHPLGAKGHFFTLGFAPEQKTVMESLATPRNREFFESILHELTGEKWTVKFTTQEGLPSVEAPETIIEMPAQKESPESFRDDPLIREALDIFKGEIKQ